MRLRTAHHALAPPVLDDRLRGFHARPVEAIEWPLRQVAIELRAIGRELRLQSIEHFFGKAAGIFLRLHHQRRHRADQRSLRHPAFAMPSQVMRHLAAAGGMTNVHGLLQIKMRGQNRKVVSIMIHVMAVARLGGPAVASPVMGDDAIAVFEEEQHLRVPVIGRQRPAVAEDDGLSFAPVFIIDVDVSAVFFSDCYVRHFDFAFLLPAYCWPRFISNRNQVRRSVSSIQTSIRLAVAMSRCSSHTLCASRRRVASVLLSSANSAIMSKGSTYSASLSSTRCTREMWPIDLSVSPPILRIRSAIGSVMAKSCSACSSRSRW